MVTIIKKESTSDTKRMTIKVYRFKFVVSCCEFCNQDSSANSPVQAVVWGGGGGRSRVRPTWVFSCSARVSSLA